LPFRTDCNCTAPENRLFFCIAANSFPAESEMADLGAPVRVSPLIRFGRWSFLVVGVAYGAYHQQRLAKREVGIREIEAQQKVIRDAKLAEEKKRNQEAEAKAIAELSMPTKK
uniref:ATP synthase F(0) complex subunit e, mitochondrial n=1 Tax=Anopheles coluzzii TaxID=1518534 RepID=A0A8W7PHK6_ANOCL